MLLFLLQTKVYFCPVDADVVAVSDAGESVDDCGGGYSESIAEMCDELQNGSIHILIQTPNGRDESGSNRDCFILNANLKSPLHQTMFRFFGRFLSLLSTQPCSVFC